MATAPSTRPAPTTVLYVDADFAWRQVIARVIGMRASFQLIESCPTIGRALTIIQQKHPAIVVSELTLPDCEGFDFLDELVAIPHPPRVLVVTNRCDEFTLHRVGRAPINGLIWKIPAIPRQLQEALHAVRDGHKFFPPEVLAERQRMQGSPHAFFKILSNAEQRLIHRFGQGPSDREIATEISRRPTTVKWHRRRILARLDLHHTIELMRWAVAKGFVRPRLPAPPCALVE